MRIRDWSSGVCSSDLKGTRPRFSVGIDSRVGVILTGRHRNGQQAFPHETRQIVYMHVRMIVEQSVTQPQYSVIAKATCQQRFDLAPVDRQRVCEGKMCSVLVVLGGAGRIDKKKTL